MNMVPEPRLASTVALLRDGEEGIETLLLRRNRDLKFAGGFWVFPGGAIDPEDIDAAEGDIERASRLAAAREAQEEAGVELGLDNMVQVSHWTTPVAEPRRFATWFYAGALKGDQTITIDGSEIHDSRWITLKQALLENQSGDLRIMPPTYVTMCQLAQHDDVETALAAERPKPVPQILPVLVSAGKITEVMYAGDAGYSAGDLSIPGPRHRLMRRDGCWRYVYQDVDPAIRPLIDYGTWPMPD